jgi:transketolase
VDANKQQLDGYTKDIMDLGDIGAKFESFGWHVQRVDGHDIGVILEAVEAAKKAEGQPSAIVLDTLKGKGCTFAEGVLFNHHMTIKPEEGAQAIKQAERELARFGKGGNQ